MKKTHFSKLKLSVAPIVLGVALVSAPAFAQDAPADEGASADDTIVVTGSLLRRTNSETASPVTVLSADSLEKRGLNTVAEAVQRLSANGAGTITQNWNTGSNFATGANAVSLRGLTVQSTLTVFDGLRMAPYPLADDGHRNFVDLNTIPSGIIERIEVLRDGASSTYGADAVAGVVNVITKKEIQGVHLDGSAGISQRGDAGEQRISATVGYGDLDDQGFNVYVNAEYQRQSALWARDRRYPFNSSDLSKICDAEGHCMANGVTNGVNADGVWNGLGTTTTPAWRPYNNEAITLVDPGGTSHTFAPGTIALAPYSVIGGCGDLTSVTLTAAQQGSTSPTWTPVEDDDGNITGYTFNNVNYSGPVYGATQCQQDLREQYSQLQPEQERLGFAGRVTANIGDRAQAYAAVNYYQVRTHTQLSPLTFAGQTTPPGAVAYNPVFVPGYLCDDATASLDGDNGCTAANGTLNPNNPFADGSWARLIYRYDQPRDIYSKSRALRGALGIAGSFGQDWNYNVDLTVSNTQLDIVQSNYLIPSRLMQVIADGTYNLVDPSANSQEIRDYIAPENRTRSTSDLWQAQATLSKELFQLPGGPFQALVGAAYRHESIDNPSANPQDDEHPYDRYYGVNSVGASGSRNVRSAFFELSAPVIDTFELSASGRYDSYSSGQSNFSPKIGAKFTPIPQVAIRGTWSKGFRIPSFNEAYGLPTTGYITQTVDCEKYKTFCDAHGNNSYATAPYSVGLTSVGNPDLEPEKSTSWTLGAIVEPVRGISFTVDYFNIKVKNLVTGVDYSDIPDLYYANNGVVDVPGITVRPQLPDNANPNALPLLGFIEYSFQNADSQQVSGLDFGLNIVRDLSSNIRWTSSADASYLIKFQKTFDSGAVQRYDGTLSPCDITSCSGSPKWRGSWQNTLEIGDAAISATVYYTGGYDSAQTDYGDVKGDCENGSGFTYRGGGPVQCKAKATWNVDLSGSYKIDDKFTIYANVMNVFDIDPPFEPNAAYGIFQFNPAWAGPNIMGRYFRLGAKVDF